MRGEMISSPYFLFLKAAENKIMIKGGGYYVHI
jgi:hypothetical protein